MPKGNFCLSRGALFSPPVTGGYVKALLLTLAWCAAAGAILIGCPASGSNDDPPEGFRITKFMINDAPGVIDQDKKIIEVVLPPDTDITKLHPTVEFVGAKIDPDPAPEETINFSEPVTYTVFSKNGSAIYYMVLVTQESLSNNRITAFALDGVDAVSVDLAEEGEDRGTVYVVVPSGTTLGGLMATIEHTGVSISPDGKVPQDFSRQVTYTVTSEPGSERVYTVTVTDTPSTENNITSFMLSGVEGIITGTDITLTVSSTTSLMAVKPVMKVSLGATVEPNPDTARDFTNPVTYTVTSASGATKTYRVTVSRMQGNDGEDFPADTVIQDPFTVSNVAEWNSAVTIIKNGGVDKNYIINVIENFDIAASSPTAFTFGSVTGITVVIRGNQTIGLLSAGNLLRFGAKQSVILRDITLTGNTNNSNWLVYVDNSSAIFDMRGSAKVTNNGGGVFVSGSFTMRDNASVSGNTTTSNGGGVYVSGSFTMRDNASVYGNKTNKYGGGVFVYEDIGKFRMAGGTIYGSGEPSGLKNTASIGAALYKGIFQNDMAEYGTFNADGTWAKNGSLSTTDSTIKVVNGVKQ